MPDLSHLRNRQDLLARLLLIFCYTCIGVTNAVVTMDKNLTKLIISYATLDSGWLMFVDITTSKKEIVNLLQRNSVVLVLFGSVTSDTQRELMT